ncbi:MAG: histidine phosphatase family protein [Corynebacterium sp.]|uniref:histidine phosphatase family protein n=1 Tax=Corynebacterium sp. TaxID=1720 RepID=UPI0026E0DA89|nr:histidine phosphatase family protein [Corynebacterium sp.]MDO5668614.1 histidine phosphatase family protein [Corynebacterium sp.]
MDTNLPAHIILVRHGVTPTTGQVLPGRAPGLHLSEAGILQARQVAARLSDVPVTALYSSPMERARETAAPTAENFGLTPVICEDLNECDFGDWTGARLSDLARLPEWTTVQKTPSQFRFPGGESFLDMRDRMAGALRRIAARHKGETVVCVGHADPIKAAVTVVNGAGLDTFQAVTIDPASVSVAKFAADGTTSMLMTNTTSGPVILTGEVGGRD